MVMAQKKKQQQIGDRVIDGDCEGQIVNVYDTHGGPVVVVRWDEDPELGVHLGYDDPHCQDFSPADFEPGGKNCWCVRPE
jgi:hypothetical protein